MEEAVGIRTSALYDRALLDPQTPQVNTVNIYAGITCAALQSVHKLVNKS